MSAQEVTKLRKKGELKKAYGLAKKLLKEDPKNIWNRRAMAWIQYDLLNNAIERNEFDRTPRILKNIDTLDLPEDEEMLFDKLDWKIGKVVFRINKSDSVNYGLINQIFDSIKGFHFPKPSESYSFLYMAFHKGYKNWNRYIEFAQWWNFDNFLEDNYQRTQLDNGRKIMAEVEQAYIAYSKKLLEGESDGPLTIQKKPNKELIQSFLPKLSSLIENHPEYRYPIYYKAKLLHEIGEEDEALRSILPFARKKQDEYWIWALLAEIVQDNDQQLACLSKSLLCDAGSDYLVKVRKSMAAKLIDRDQLMEAKAEIEQLVSTREANDWKISDTVKNWMNSEWYSEIGSNESNKRLYRKWAPEAERLLFQTVEPTIVVVDYVNEDKNILNFIDKKRNTGFFNYSKYLDEVSIGDVLEVRFDEKDDAYHTVHTVEKTTQKPDTLIKPFSGACNIIDGKGFGFVNDMFLSPQMVEEYNLSDEEEIRGEAIPSYDKKKSKWGWQVVRIYNN